MPDLDVKLHDCAVTQAQLAQQLHSTIPATGNVVAYLTLHLQNQCVYFAACLTAWGLLCRYVYIVDSQNRVRWSASGRAEPTEAKAFIECTNELLGDT
jgi:hypothetical protein